MNNNARPNWNAIIRWTITLALTIASWYVAKWLKLPPFPGPTPPTTTESPR